MTDPNQALAELGEGRPIVIPTDTVYGVAVSPALPGAVEAVFAIKNRPDSKPLAVLGASLDDLSEVVEVSRRARAVAERFWPGPLTLVLPRRREWSHYLGSEPAAGVAVRVPRCAPALELLVRSGPLAVSSANRSGRPPARTVAEARSALGAEVSVFVDGGRCDGRPSTIVSLLGQPRTLRRGTLEPGPVLQMLTS